MWFIAEVSSAFIFHFPRQLSGGTVSFFLFCSATRTVADFSRDSDWISEVQVHTLIGWSQLLCHQTCVNGWTCCIQDAGLDQTLLISCSFFFSFFFYYLDWIYSRLARWDEQSRIYFLFFPQLNSMCSDMCNAVHGVRTMSQLWFLSLRRIRLVEGAVTYRLW